MRVYYYVTSRVDKNKALQIHVIQVLLRYRLNENIAITMHYNHRAFTIPLLQTLSGSATTPSRLHSFVQERVSTAHKF